MYKRAAVPLLTIFLIITFLCSSGLTLASWRSEGSTVNSITIGSVSGRIVEEFEQGQKLDPAATVTKKVQVENTGALDVAVRVKVEKAWGDYRDENGKLIINPELSTDNILISYNTTDWLYKDSDGYFYYKGVLAPTEITPILFDSFTIDGETTGGDYKNKSADIIVTMEIIQAAYHGLSYWGMDFVDLGFTYTQTSQIPIETTVDFNDPDNGFSFNTNNGDLFANFKSLIPGDSRSQVISVTNRWNGQTEIFLNASYVEQSASTDTYELVEKLLKEYAVITISDSQGKTIYTGPIYGNYDVEPTGTSSMKYPISLGIFKANESKKLYVNLSLSTAIDNEYKDLIGLIQWCFTAEAKGSSSGESSSLIDSSNVESSPSDPMTSDPSVGPPTTGDKPYTMLYAAIAMLSAAALVALYCSKKKSYKS